MTHAAHRRTSFFDWIWPRTSASEERRDSRPYGDILQEISGLRQLKPGWNSYRAPQIDQDAIDQALKFVSDFQNLSRKVPRPAVIPRPDGGLALQWFAGDSAIEITFLGKGGEFSVTNRHTDEVVHEGRLSQVDLLKDVVNRYVVTSR